ncbi:MAG TPA: TetR/AcrR family transcriptional regulator [Dermatophilaceae bacterium]|jgi:AcrR family transcriptional regulator
MGRPRLHDERTGAALLDAAEGIVETEGPEALSVRRVADEVGTTSRAVYTVFGSKLGMVVALGSRAFDLLGAAVEALPVTEDPAADLVASGVVGFRTFALQHPALFRIGVQRDALSSEEARGFAGAATVALGSLHARIARLSDNGGLGHRSVPDATWEFHALCEGLAALELRCNLPSAHAQHLWTDALSALLAGWRL